MEHNCSHIVRRKREHFDCNYLKNKVISLALRTFDQVQLFLAG